MEKSKVSATEAITVMVQNIREGMGHEEGERQIASLWKLMYMMTTDCQECSSMGFFGNL